MTGEPQSRRMWAFLNWTGTIVAVCAYRRDVMKEVASWFAGDLSWPQIKRQTGGRLIRVLVQPEEPSRG